MAYTAIDDPSAYFKVQLYAGDGAANNAITFDDTDTDMQPDLVWIKNRDATDDHCLFDAVRGATKLLNPEDTAAETTDTDTLDSFTSDGFQVDADVKVNTDAEKYVAWCWKLGTTSGITTNAGTDITPSGYSFNATSGVSAVAYTANNTDDQQIPHGLGVAPHMIISKGRTAYQWGVYHQSNTSAPETDFLVFNDPCETSDEDDRWSDQAPDSVNWTVGDGNDTNKDTGTYIAYLFTGKQGFSQFGSYDGNGNADGTFVYTGFRPAFVITKSFDSSSSWHIFDNKREGYNVDNDPLVVDLNTVEATTDMIDLLSNGFKFRISTDPNVAESYIYMAFAEAPFVNSNGVPCNAR